MPLPLDDHDWHDLETCYRDSGDLMRWLEEAYAPGKLTGELLGKILNEVNHQGDSCSAMYAVAPHLIELARSAEAKMGFDLLTCAGTIYARADKDGNFDCPDFLEDEFRAAAPDGAKLICQWLPQAEGFPEFQWGIAALAAFMGHGSFARLVSQLDLHQGRFHYPLLDSTIPVDP